MAESLQCPSCGTRTRVGSPAPETITCGRCGRGLKLGESTGGGVAPPPRTRRGAAPAEAPSDAGSDVPPPPRRRSSAAVADVEAPVEPSAPPRRRGSVDAGTSALSVPPEGGGPVVVGPVGSAPPPTRQRGATQGPSRLVRILVWVVALPIALIVVGIPARKAGYLTGQKLLDVIVKHDVGRFVPLLVIVALWALITAILVTVFLAGLERLTHGADASNEVLAPSGRGGARRGGGAS